MPKKLNWVCNNYEDSHQEYVAIVVQIPFSGIKNLVIHYSIIKDYEKGFLLHFVCNDEMFRIGNCDNLEIGYLAAEEHLKLLHDSL